MESDNQDQVGRRVRSIREAQELSLRALADKSGLSINTISRIERGENSPTVASLRRLAGALSVSIVEFFHDSSFPDLSLVRREKRMRSERNGAILESLAGGWPDRRLEPFLMTLQPGASSHSRPVSHDGDEFIHCLQGNVVCVAGEQQHVLSAGDSLVFRASQPHLCRNEATGYATVMLVLERQLGGALARTLHLDF